MEKLYNQFRRETPEQVFKNRLAIEEFVLDFSLQKEGMGFLLDKNSEGKLILVPLKQEKVE